VAQSTATSPGGKKQIGFGGGWKRNAVEIGLLILAAIAVLLVMRSCLGCVAERAVDHMPPTVDAKIGKTAAEEMRTKYKLGAQPTPEQSARAERIFDELYAGLTADEKAIVSDPQVTVVVDEQVNAFCLPGGEVFVLTGLFDRVGDDDGLVRGVLAHELGHAVKRHGLRAVARHAAFGIALSLMLGNMDDMASTLAAGAAQLDGLAYSRDKETEADRFGYELLTRIHQDPDGLARFLESLGSQPVPELLSTHPDPVERAAEIRRWMKEGPPQLE
jgi:predicted Zn-dependent protease